MSRPNSFFAVRSQLSPKVDLTLGLAGIALLVIAWCAATYGGFIKPIYLPSPTGIWEGAMEFHQKDWLLPAIWRSFWRVTRALFWVIVIGVPLGVFMGAFTPLDALLRKIVNGAKSIPPTGVIGLIIIWFSIGEQAKTVFLFLGSIFFMIVMVKSAVLNVPEDYLRVAKDLGASSGQMILRVLLPGALPQIVDAIAVCNGIMWTYILLAEFINASEDQLGLGYLLYIGARTQEPGKVFAVLIVIALISTLTDWALRSIRSRFFNW